MTTAEQRSASWLFCTSLLFAYLIPALPGSVSGTTTIILFAALTACMLWFWHRSNDGNPDTLRLILLLGVGARLALIAADPYTTHDLERYLWDGAVALSGLDPYIITPNHAEAAELRALWPTPPEHADYPTLYPPVALALFSLSAAAGPEGSFWLWKLITAGISIAALFLAHAALRRCNAERHLALVALSPLMLMEGGLAAHIDIVTTFFVTAVLWAWVRQHWLLCGVMIGLGTATKLSPIFLLVPLLVALHYKELVRILVGAGTALAISYGTALSLGLWPLGSLPVFFDKWRFGSPLYSAIELSVFAPYVDWLLPLMAIGLLGLSAHLARRDVVLAMGVALSAPLLVSPVVFPWYLLVLVPICALRPHWFFLVWLSLVPISYEVLNGFEGWGGWQPASWPLGVIALGWVLSLAITWVKRYPWNPRVFKLS